MILSLLIFKLLMWQNLTNNQTYWNRISNSYFKFLLNEIKLGILLILKFLDRGINSYVAKNFITKSKRKTIEFGDFGRAGKVHWNSGNVTKGYRYGISLK